MEFVRADPQRYEMTEDTAEFEKLLVALDQIVLSGSIFMACIEQDFEENDDSIDVGISVRNNSAFMKNLLDTTKVLIENSSKVIATQDETTERLDMVGYFALYALFRRLCPPSIPPDEKLYRKLWSLQKNMPIVTLYGSIIWSIPDFLIKYSSCPCRKLDPADYEAFRKTYVKKFDDEFGKQTLQILVQTYAWLTRIRAVIPVSTRHELDQTKHLHQRLTIMYKGYQFACRMSQLLNTCLNLHVAIKAPLSKRLLRPLSLALEILKIIEFTFAKHQNVFNESLPAIMNICFKRLNTRALQPIRNLIDSARKIDESTLDQCAALNIFQYIIQTTDTLSYQRQSILELSYRIMLGTNSIPERDAEQTIIYLRLMTFGSNYVNMMMLLFPFEICRTPSPQCQQ